MGLTTATTGRAATGVVSGGTDLYLPEVPPGAEPGRYAVGRGFQEAQVGQAREAQAAGFQNSATGAELGFYAARSYSLMRPPRTSRRLIRWWERSATG